VRETERLENESTQDTLMISALKWGQWERQGGERGEKRVKTVEGVGVGE